MDTHSAEIVYIVYITGQLHHSRVYTAAAQVPIYFFTQTSPTWHRIWPMRSGGRLSRPPRSPLYTLHMGIEVDAQSTIEQHEIAMNEEYREQNEKEKRPTGMSQGTAFFALGWNTTARRRARQM